MTPSLSLAQSDSGQGGNCSVPKKEREIHGVDFRVVNEVFQCSSPRSALRIGQRMITPEKNKTLGP